MSDVFEVHFDGVTPAWSVADDAEEILHAVLDEERPVQFEDDGYDRGEAA